MSIEAVALTIRFKEYLLNRDVASRRVILNTCIMTVEGWENEKRAQILVWLQNLLAINDIMSSKERKEQVRYDACWDELHYDLVKSDGFMTLIGMFRP
jgi:hypothetical protein